MSKSAVTTYDDRYFENFKFVVFKNAEGDMMHNVSGTLLVELRKMIITFTIRIKSSPKRQDFDLLVFQSNVDTCKVSQGVLGNFVIRSLISTLKDTNFNFECPLKKGFFYLYNIPNVDTSFFPAFISREQSKYIEWELAIGAKTKFPKIATPSQLFFVKLRGGSID